MWQLACRLWDICILDGPSSQPGRYKQVLFNYYKINKFYAIHGIFIGTFDHSQIIKELKFQVGGHLSSVTLVTSIISIKPMVSHVFLIFRFTIARPDITHRHQNIPSAYGMPTFEDITSITPNVYSNIKYCTVNSSTDITGAWGEQYSKLVLVAHKTKMFCSIIPFLCTEFLTEYRIVYRRRVLYD